MSIFDLIPFCPIDRKQHHAIWVTKHRMLLVKRRREFIARIGEGIKNFSLKGNRKKQLKNRMKEKACQQMSFTDWFW